ncbi:MAG: ATP-binding protein [Bacteroidota bacterium]
MSEIEILKRRVERELRARKEAERILEDKAQELYLANNSLRVLNENLELRISERTVDLTAEQMRLSALITNLDSGILLEDERRHIVIVNQLFCTLFHIPAPPQFLIGTDCSNSAELSKSLFAEPDAFVQRINEILHKRELVLNESLSLANGQIYQRTFIPLFDGQRYLGHLWKYNDVSEAVHAGEELRRSEDKYRGIIENMELGLMEVDNQGRIVRPYPRFCQMVGYEPEELEGQDAVEILLPPEFISVLDRQTEDRMEGKAGVYEIQLRKKDGSLIWAMISGAPIVDLAGDIVGSIGIHYDVTRQKLLQQELEEARKRAEAAQEAEKQFLANMSHEIRTPLNAIIGMAHLLADTNPTEEQTEYLGILKSSAEMLRILISDVLDLSKIRAGKMETQAKDFDLPDLIRSMVKSLQLRIEDKPIKVLLDIDPKIKNLVTGDDLLLHQIMANLLGNAEKFTANGEIKVQVAQETEPETHPLWIRISVSDTGIGIPPEKHDLIFQSFRQVDGDTKRKFGGTGLGLAITKQLVDLQGGTIELISELGAGAQFIVRLPYIDSGVIPISDKLMEAKQSLHTHGKRILVVEDNYMNRKYIGTLLRKWNVEHEFAFNGREAVEKTQEWVYDLILMDIQMPEMDGYEATIAIRNQEGPNQSIPILALTASAMMSQKDKAFSAGMDDYLSKPFKPSQLFEKMAFYMGAGDVSNEPHVPEIFTFDARLDQQMLYALYGDDLDYAHEMFDMFLNTAAVEFREIRPKVETENWLELARLAHKLKPSFGMVGLCSLEKMMDRIETDAKTDPNPDALKLDLLQAEQYFEEGCLVVQSELHRIGRILKK